MDAVAELAAIKTKMESLVAIEGEDKISIERRMGHLEKSIATQDVLLRRNTEILDEIRMSLNKPTNWAEWIMAATGLAGGLSSIIWAVFIVPLETRVDNVEERSSENRAHIRDIGDYAKETRSVLDAHVIRHEHKQL